MKKNTTTVLESIKNASTHAQNGEKLFKTSTLILIKVSTNSIVVINGGNQV